MVVASASDAVVDGSALVADAEAVEAVWAASSRTENGSVAAGMEPLAVEPELVGGVIMAKADWISAMAEGMGAKGVMLIVSPLR